MEPIDWESLKRKLRQKESRPWVVGILTLLGSAFLLRMFDAKVVQALFVVLKTALFELAVLICIPIGLWFIFSMLWKQFVAEDVEGSE